MKQLLTILSVAALAIAAPAHAKPGKGHGHHGKSHASIGYHGYGTAGCPPGLAKKGNGCLPPGQARKRFNVGQRYSGNYGRLWNYNQIPYDLRERYDFDRGYRYYYGDGYLYRVDPRTMLIQQVVSALLR
jgi:hypothetical protein